MSTDSERKEVAFTAEFKRNIRRLAKRYQSIRSDVEPIITELEAGQTPCDQISGTGYTIYKVRVQNSDIKKGKSSGYRVIYYLATSDQVVLLTIYSKSDQGDISLKRLREIVAEFG